MPFDGSVVYPLDPAVAARVLGVAADYIERGWCKGHFARHLFGWGCSPYALLARRFCARGAIQRALWYTDEVAEIDAHEAYLAGRIILAAHRTSVGVSLIDTRNYVAAMSRQPLTATEIDLEAIQRWSDSSHDGVEVATQLRFTAAELSG